MERILKRLAFIAQYYCKKTYYILRQRAPSLLSLHFKSFPAVHLNKMDGLDFIFKFGSELLVLVIVGLGVLTNFYFFAGSNGVNFADNSLNAKFLNNHTALNPQLYERNNSIVTKVARGGFVPQAYAETDFTGISSDQAAATDSDTTGAYMDEDNNSFVQPNADSVSQLVAKQVKIYQTQPGDTLKSIGAQFGISAQTISWANNLTSPKIKPGWYLKILPTDGILYEVDSNDTLPDIANTFSPERYNKDKKVKEDAANQLTDKIISYNLLDSPEDIEGGQILIIPGGVIATPPAPPKPKPTPRVASGSSNISNIVRAQRASYSTEGHMFPWGQCTYYVAKWMHDNHGYDIPWGGNAKAWLANAKAYGAVVSREPAAGAIVVTTESRWGHVAVVTGVTDDHITITEMNYKGKGIVNDRTIPRSSGVIRGYIYH